MKRLLVLTLAAVALGACARREAVQPAPSAQIAGERLVVRESLVADVKPVDAVVATADLAEARARIGGTIARLLVTENDQVRKGQLLAVVSDPRIDFQTRAYDAEALAAKAQVDRAAADLGRIRTLYDKGIYARARLDQAEADTKAARGTLAAALAQRAASAELAAQGAILAPGDGRVISARVPAGSVVVPGQSVVTIAAGAPVLRIEIPERQAGALRVGARVPVLAQDGRPGPVAGVVRKVYPAVSAGRVVADIEAPQAAGAPIGQKVTVAVALGERRAVVVPARYIITRFGLDYVRLIRPGGTSAEVPVQLAARPREAPAEVLSGLQDGDVIVAPVTTLAAGSGR